VAIDLQKNTGMGLLSHGSFASSEQLLQKEPLFFTQLDFALVGALSHLSLLEKYS